MKKRDELLWNKIFLKVSTALIKRGDITDSNELAAETCRIADSLFWMRYKRILDESTGTEALRKIMELDGYSDDTIEYMIKKFFTKDDPLLGYAAYGNRDKAAGQLAISKFLSKGAVYLETGSVCLGQKK